MVHVGGREQDTTRGGGGLQDQAEFLAGEPFFVLDDERLPLGPGETTMELLDRTKFNVTRFVATSGHGIRRYARTESSHESVSGAGQGG